MQADRQLVYLGRNIVSMRDIIDDCMQQISQALQPFINVRPEDIVNRHPPWEI